MRLKLFFKKRYTGKLQNLFQEFEQIAFSHVLRDATMDTHNFAETVLNVDAMSLCKESVFNCFLKCINM